MMIIIWLVGFITAYYTLRRAIRHGRLYSKWSWGDIVVCSFMSLFSWLSVVAGLVTWGIIFLATWNSKKDPPKWL